MRSDGIPRKTLQERVQFCHVFYAQKHGLTKRGQSVEEYADERINAMTQAEFLGALSDALAEMHAELDDWL